MNKLTKLAVCLAVAMNSAGFVSSISAATATTTIPVSATVIDSCTIISTPLAFGNYNGISGAMLDVAASVSPVCTNGTSYAISLDAGVGVGATASSRKLTGPMGANLMYGIYTDAARTTVWGDGANGTVQQFGLGIGSVQSIQMYGRIPADQNSPVGAYSDTITVTVSYWSPSP